MTYDEAIEALRRLEGERQSVPCPDGIKGCLVAHFKRVAGPIEMVLTQGKKIRTLPWEEDSRDGEMWALAEEMSRMYSIEPRSNVYELRIQHWLCEYGEDIVELYPSLEAAKSAAHADYEAKVMKAFGE